MKKIVTGITLILLALPPLISGGMKDGLNYEFIQDGLYYSFRCSFVLEAELDCLINVTFGFEHISKYAPGVKSIELVRQGDTWYEVTYRYRKLMIFENTSSWRRTLDQENQRVVFEMISSRNNINILPKVHSSRGYYQIMREGDALRVEYFQECSLKSGILKNTYINQAKKEAIKFLREFKDYTERTCS